jgi:endonuclease III
LLGAFCDLFEIDEALRAVYGEVPRGSAPLGNKRNPLDELVFIQLSVRTPEREYGTIYRALHQLVRGRWERLLSVDVERAVAVLRRGGMARIKVQRLSETFRSLQARFGRVTLAPLRRMADAAAEGLLLELPGVGKKVARCILLYSLDRDVFPVDTHCFRILERLGLVPHGRTYRQSHDALQALVPSSIRRSLHVNLVRHGRMTCTPHQPRCRECALLACCPTGQRRTTGAAEAS